MHMLLWLHLLKAPSLFAICSDGCSYFDGHWTWWGYIARPTIIRAQPWWDNIQINTIHRNLKSIQVIKSPYAQNFEWCICWVLAALINFLVCPVISTRYWLAITCTCACNSCTVKLKLNWIELFTCYEPSTTNCIIWKRVLDLC